MFKTVFKFIVYNTIKITHYLYDNSFNRKLKDYKDIIHSIWLKFEMKKTGNNVIFQMPILLLGGKYITIGNNVTFRKLCILTAHDKYYTQEFCPSILIGNNCSFGEHNHITAINEIIIGNGVLTGSWVTITDNSHGKTDLKSLQTPPIERKLYSKGKVVIDDNVWIGDKVTILPGVHIGEGAVIAANTVVSKDIPPFSVVAGIPGKIIKTNNLASTISEI